MNAAPGYTGAGEPSVAYDLTGNKYITGIQLDSLGNGAVAIQKNSGAASIVVPAFFTGGSADKDWLQVDTSSTSPYKNHLYISATQFDPSNNSELPSRVPRTVERASQPFQSTPNNSTPPSISSATLPSGGAGRFMSHGCAALPPVCKRLRADGSNAVDFQVHRWWHDLVSGKHDRNCHPR